MDDTPADSLISDLESVDAADAPDVADAVAEALAAALDEGAEEGSSAPPT